MNDKTATPRADDLWDAWGSSPSARALLRLLTEREIDVLREGFLLGVAAERGEIR